MKDEEVVITMMSMLILAGLAVLWMAMASRRKIREMEHRERLAMIERGLMPAPEVDPGGFERRSGIAPLPESAAAARTRSAGVMMIGVGLALLMLITFVGETPTVGFGVGGAFAILGAAFLVNSRLMARQHLVPPASLPVPRHEAAQPPPTPPNVGP